jgi:hypothetical protein
MSNALIGFRTHDIPACSITPQLTALLRDPAHTRTLYFTVKSKVEIFLFF